MKLALSLLALTIILCQHANECALHNKIVQQRKEIANLKANVQRLQGDSLRQRDDYKYLLKRK